MRFLLLPFYALLTVVFLLFLAVGRPVVYVLACLPFGHGELRRGPRGDICNRCLFRV